jgi:hypothetical protein
MVGCENTTLAYQDWSLWPNRQMFRYHFGGCAVGYETMEVTIVHPNDGRMYLQCSFKFTDGMYLDQSIHSQFAGEGKEIHQRLVIESSYDQQDCVGAIGSRFVNLIRIDYEIFA